jgi:hypothetical protein
MKRLITLATLLLALAFPMGAAANGPTVDNLIDAGWICYDPDGPGGPLEIHCYTKANDHQFVSAAISAMVFDPDTGEFLGTEVLRFTGRDLSGIPCPTGHEGYWEDLGFAWACHHWLLI